MESENEKDIQTRSSGFYTICPSDIERLRIGPPGSKLYYMRVFRSFQYPRIPDREHIRLLHLYPPKNNCARLYGDLRVHQLDAQCDYEAISYSWGDYPKFTQCIFIKGQIVKITENLYAALMAYRHPTKSRVLWVDAICINQADKVEKSQQVSVMADIYSKAKVVQVWLGPHWAWMVEAVQFIETVSSKAASFGINDESYNSHESVFEDFPTIDISYKEANNLIKDAIQAHVDVFYMRSWFNRVWVVQEVTLAADLVVSCGLTTIKWDVLAIGTKILRGAFRKVPIAERERMNGVKSAWQIVWYRHNFKILDPYFNRSHHFMTNNAGILMSNRDCSDDRDRVYSMLALIKSPYTMAPDYDMTTAEVYTTFTRQYSPNSQLYRAGLCRRQYQPPSEKITDSVKTGEPIDISDRNYLPSWVPEFRPFLNDAWASTFTGVYSTASTVPYFFLPNPEILNIMHVTGTIFGEIYAATAEYSGKGSAPHLAVEPGFFFSIIDLLQDILASPIDPDAELKPKSEPPWLILAKTLTSGAGEFERAEHFLSLYTQFQSLGALGSGSLPWLTAIWHQFEAHCLSPVGEVFQHILLKTLGGKPKPLSTDGDIAMGFLNFIANIIEDNCLIMTHDCYLGLVPKGTRCGDFIAVINGLDMPYVVRLAGNVKYKDIKMDGDGQEADGYQFDNEITFQVIGPCYLHGIMGGEIYTNRDAPQFSHLSWRRYDGDGVDSLDGELALV